MFLDVPSCMSKTIVLFRKMAIYTKLHTYTHNYCLTPYELSRFFLSLPVLTTDFLVRRITIGSRHTSQCSLQTYAVCYIFYWT
uniref:Uncharacterized protein n=1 Tax=Octopus bimaculoides TaxID=37653 RepID=A0A0L8HGX2_OCTBM